MDERARGWLELGAVQLALVTAGLHLVWGVPRAFVYLRIGRFVDPRPFAFTLSALAVIAAVVWLYRGGPRRPLYAALGAVMAGYLAGYAVWHLVGHPILDPAGGGVATTFHPADPISLVVGHLATDPFALATVLAETGALVAFVILLAFPAR